MAEKSSEQIAIEIKKGIDDIVLICGKKATPLLEQINKLPIWLVLKDEEPRIILLGIYMYVEGILSTLYSK